MRRDRAAARRARRGVDAGARGATLEPIGLHDPRFLAPLLAAVATVLISVTFLATSTDLWQHLLVGKVIWQSHSVPQRHLWSYPIYGRPEVLPSWGFCALLWPFWSLGGVLGLQLWRWITALAAFALGWAAARVMGACGLTPLIVVAACVLPYRMRSEARPESLIAVLIALQILVLERRRARGGGGGVAALLAIAWVWANVHISYYIGLALIAVHAAVEWRARRAGGALPAVRSAGVRSWLEGLPLAWVLVGAIAISFANPFGWRALWQPFDYFLFSRHDPVLRMVSELRPLSETWRIHVRSGLPVLLVLWPMLVAWRPRGRPFDLAEAATCTLFVAHTLLNQRFGGLLAVAMVPYVARDLSAWAGALRWPHWVARAGSRAALATVASLLVAVPEWTRPQTPIGIGFRSTYFPGPACDFIARHGLRGRIFNPNYFGGYLLWRFWPDPGRLPFMDVHQSGTPRDRDLYAYCFAKREAWDELTASHRFDLALVDGHQEWLPWDRLLDFLDADSSWALVFRDDAAAIYLRRDGALGRAADTLAYRDLPGGAAAFEALGQTVRRDPALRARLRAQLERSVRESPLAAGAHVELATLAYMERDPGLALRHLEAALRIEPGYRGAHLRLGYLYLAAGEPRAAIGEFERERALGGTPLDEYRRMGEAWERLGDRRRAVDSYHRALAAHPDDVQSRQALWRLGAKE